MFECTNSCFKKILQVPTAAGPGTDSPCLQRLASATNKIEYIIFLRNRVSSVIELSGNTPEPNPPSKTDQSVKMIMSVIPEPQTRGHLPTILFSLIATNSRNDIMNRRHSYLMFSQGFSDGSVVYVPNM